MTSDTVDSGDIRKLIERLAEESINYSYGLEFSPHFRAVTELPPERLAETIAHLLDWFNSIHSWTHLQNTWQMQAALLRLLSKPVDLPRSEVMRFLQWSIKQDSYFYRGTPQVIRVVEQYLHTNVIDTPLQELVGQLIDKLQAEVDRPNVRQWIIRLRKLAGLVPPTLPLVAGEAWAETAVADIIAMPPDLQTAWRELLLHCQTATASQPSARWLNAAQPALARIGTEGLKTQLIRWFELVDQPRTQPLAHRSPFAPDPNLMLQPTNADILKGLAWRCAHWDDRAVAQALGALALTAYRKVPGAGPRCSRLGNAAVWTLGAMPGLEGIGQLAILKLKLKTGSVQKVIEKALAGAAGRAGLSAQELEEIALPTYDLQQPGYRLERFGDYQAEMQVVGKTAVNVAWLRPDGKRQASAPAAVKTEHAAALKAFTQSGKDIVKMLPAQSDRLERMFLEQRRWRLPLWRERYLDHPLVGALARRLIWKFTRGDQAASGIWWKDQLVGRDDVPIEWLDEATQVELWHPLQVSTEVVLAWRAWLEQHQVQQPFKQAHREIYLLTDAERATRTYSNRFAAHILRQHQFHALCAARGWHNKLRLMVDDVAPPASRGLPAWDLRAEYWIDSAGDNAETDINQAGTFHYIATDQVRFYRLAAPENLAHASGGDRYIMRGPAGPGSEPVPLEDVPALVLSEILRDVDLFVGVASVGNDPTWGDGGGDNRYANYWRDFSFGELSEAAGTRRELLVRLLPRLKIANRCQLTERFLLVRGDRHTYKIHLGSGNILIEPHDQYLCIVPNQRTVDAAPAGPIFLPYEGDRTLAIILSKAFLLANDTAIKDQTILRQL